MNEEVYMSKFDKLITPRIEKLEKVTERLTRRSRKTVKAVMSPIPIFNSLSGENVKGVVLKHMFIGSGTIRKGKVWLSSKPKNGASLVITIENDLGNSSKTYNIQRRDLLIEPNTPIQSGDRLSAAIYSTDPEDFINECWVSIQFVPDMPDSVIKQYLFDEIEKDVSEEAD